MTFQDFNGTRPPPVTARASIAQRRRRSTTERLVLRELRARGCRARSRARRRSPGRALSDRGADARIRSRSRARWIAARIAWWRAGPRRDARDRAPRRARRAARHASSLRRYARDRRAELGYWLGADAWGHGFATEAARRARRVRLRASSGSSAIYAQVLAGNAASCRVLEKLGMMNEGMRRQPHPQGPAGCTTSCSTGCCATSGAGAHRARSRRRPRRRPSATPMHEADARVPITRPMPKPPPAAARRCGVRRASASRRAPRSTRSPGRRRTPRLTAIARDPQARVASASRAPSLRDDLRGALASRSMPAGQHGSCCPAARPLVVRGLPRRALPIATCAPPPVLVSHGVRLHPTGEASRTATLRRAGRIGRPAAPPASRALRACSRSTMQRPPSCDPAAVAALTRRARRARRAARCGPTAARCSAPTAPRRGRRRLEQLVDRRARDRAAVRQRPRRSRSTPVATGFGTYKLVDGATWSLDPHEPGVRVRRLRRQCRSREQRARHARLGPRPLVAPRSGVLDRARQLPRRHRVSAARLRRADAHARYPVLFMHDGQNVWDNHTCCFGHTGWEVNVTLDAEIAAGQGRADHRDRGATTRRTATTSTGLDDATTAAFEQFQLTSCSRTRSRKCAGTAAKVAIAGSSLGGLVSMELALAPSRRRTTRRRVTVRRVLAGHGHARRAARPLRDARQAAARDVPRQRRQHLRQQRRRGRHGRDPRHGRRPRVAARRLAGLRPGPERPLLLHRARRDPRRAGLEGPELALPALLVPRPRGAVPHTGWGFTPRIRGPIIRCNCREFCDPPALRAAWPLLYAPPP